MTGPGRRKAVILTAAEAARLSALLATLDEFLRSSPEVAAELAVFLGNRGSRLPEFEAFNLIDELSFTAHGHRSRLAGSDGAAAHQETR